MRREVRELVGSGLLLAGLIVATIATLAPTAGASVARAPAAGGAAIVAAGSANEPRGLQLMRVKGCFACHALGLESSASVGPSLNGLAQRAGTRKPEMTAEAYVHESLRSPSAFKAPGYEAQTFGMPDLGLSDEEIGSLTAFLLHFEPE